MKTKTKMKKVDIATPDFRIWCERCCIRIAPHEERTTVEGKTYHPGCHSKLFSSAGRLKG